MIKKARSLVQSPLQLRRLERLQQSRPLTAAAVELRTPQSSFQQSSIAQRWAAFQGGAADSQVSFRRGPGEVGGGENSKDGMSNISPDLMRIQSLRRNEPSREDFSPGGIGAREYSQAHTARSSPEEALAEWAETLQGQARPQEGATVEEQYENLLKLLDDLADPAAAEAAASPERG